jgi:hypothetical protein
LVSEHTIVPQDFQMGGLENRQLGEIKLEYPIVPFEREKWQF